MPKPCGQPLKPNPFEAYRDPLTGQWKVNYPSYQSTAQMAGGSSIASSKRAAKCRYRETSPAQEVA